MIGLLKSLFFAYSSANGGILRINCLYHTGEVGL